MFMLFSGVVALASATRAGAVSRTTCGGRCPSALAGFAWAPMHTRGTENDWAAVQARGL